MKRWIAAMVALLSCVAVSQAQTDNLGAAPGRWALRANLVRWAALSPSLGVEYHVRPRWALTAGYTWADYTFRGGSRRYALSEVSAELRCYADDNRLYAGLYAVGGQFNNKLSATGRQGDHFGLGLSAGWQAPLSPRLQLDLGVAAGWLKVSHGERYKYQDDLEVWRQDFSRSALAPLALRVALVYTFSRKGGGQ